MNIILNLESLRPPITGIGIYAQNLVKGLKVHSAVSGLHCFADTGNFDLDQIVEVPRSRIGYLLRRYLRRLPLTYRARSAMRGIMFRKWSASMKHAIYHEPSFVLKPFDGLCVTTIHDLSYIHYADFHPAERVKYLEREIPKTLARAAHVITDSDYVRREIIGILGFPEDKVTSVPLGVDERFHPRAFDELAPILTRYGLLHAKYLLFVGTFEPRKNLSGVIHAYSMLPNALRGKYLLVHIGPEGWRSKSTEKAFNAMKRSGQAHRIGYVPSEDMPYLYAGAHAFVFPSIYEGFGLPLLEAMASGIPVLASNRSSMPEVVGDAGLLTDPEDMDGLANALSKLLSDNDLRSYLAKKGETRANFFSWKKSVDKTVNIYRKVKGMI